MPKKFDETEHIEYAEKTLNLDLSQYDRRVVLGWVAKSRNDELYNHMLHSMREAEDLGKAPTYLQFAIADLIREKLFLENKDYQNQGEFEDKKRRIKVIERELRDLTKTVHTAKNIIENITKKRFDEDKRRYVENEDIHGNIADFFDDFGLKMNEKFAIVSKSQ